MKNRYQWILKRAAALMVAFMLTLSILPAATAASDLGDLQITVSWVDGNGETRSAEATLIEAEEAGENCFWVLVPADAPLNGLTFSAVHPSHEYEFSIGEWGNTVRRDRRRNVAGRRLYPRDRDRSGDRQHGRRATLRFHQDG